MKEYYPRFLRKKGNLMRKIHPDLLVFHISETNEGLASALFKLTYLFNPVKKSKGPIVYFKKSR